MAVLDRDRAKTKRHVGPRTAPGKMRAKSLPIETVIQFRDGARRRADDESFGDGGAWFAIRNVSNVPESAGCPACDQYRMILSQIHLGAN